MSNNIPPFKQEPHKLLVIPGPVEIADDVLFANAHPCVSHTSPEFVKVFGDCIRMTREVLFAPKGQPFLISGSGTLGWDQVASNLIERGENALVLHSGYFADSFADCLEVYGAKVDQLKAPIGLVPTQDQIEAALKTKKYKLLTVTHCDTSTAVLSDVKAVAETVKRVSPDTLVVVDGICSVASEEIRFDDWKLDVVMAASQKGLGTPPGLSIIVASPAAISAFSSRTTSVSSYYASWSRWLPIMKAYEGGSPAYFATPPVNLIYAYEASLKTITKGKVGLEERFAAHKAASARIKNAAAQLGFKQIPQDAALAANGMTTLYYPDGLSAADIIPRLGQMDIVVAAGLHKDIKDKYFRIGHMGVSVVDTERGDVDRLITALTEVVNEARASKGA